MNCDVQLVNFPKSPLVREQISLRLQSYFNKFLTRVISVKALLSTEGHNHSFKITIKAGRINTCIHATANNVNSCIDKALNKLENFLRRQNAKTKHKMTEFISHEDSAAFFPA